MYKKNYKLKKTISMKQFISEFGENFSDHIKKRLMELDLRCVLTRENDENILDLKHVEHTKFDCKCNNSKNEKKEYAYGEFVVVDGILYFSEKCAENSAVMQSPIVNTVYTSLSNDNSILFQDTSLKKVDDNNIDYVIDTLLTVYPNVSQRYIDILKHMTSY
ncbi:hypothetical protein CPAST_c38430 [Clostridium pasteurianum DSM 525 = ATCC 6013]|uniref:Uncharacterized protein n=1 Tax=Clostridium pasteurianum DSM 525 = ATCC 6013 TaxID=1262449 RepID=A0A0H3J7I7_CLOPA|nr:hypothetical protein [Clostridium pasteurianum]AJA49881.1 hypothetical protein CPAST_c38430 [Clostridium pasteurianum DSM 525 = ATCC 6013]AJA53869.1 hypothetical protein CLPA_c38430 [Clostridium pasteurianum DSM 525 = ATCC 6013]AOZ77024.1 hypothetical protein AQ983_18695 [Clostridium pasteurianum DSM 525 = ATCC 6013]AOZ80821.1 hypothetical protein AQ984_18690 [Clostridium pasteurianum]ELP57841.1 hypothetical protein F502_17792 [Clostridium pasteurianum DSM 525 = ATCC 6013]